MAGLAAARTRGRVGGRPPALSGRRLAHARELAAAGVPVAEIATRCWSAGRRCIGLSRMRRRK
jgi:DNA invertase Pin-like site-specific DNA recombinase